MSYPFTLTQEGFKEAVAYLKFIGRYGDVEKEMSTDGFTIVHLANTLWEAA